MPGPGPELAFYSKLKSVNKDDTNETKIYAATNPEGSLVAIKEFPFFFGHGVPATMIRELNFLQELDDHPNIIKVMGFGHEDGFGWIALEFMWTDLYELVRSDEKRVLMPTRSYRHQLLSALECIHSHRILHGDIKTRNILVFGDIVKIADFGISRKIKVAGHTGGEFCTRIYAPPEILLETNETSLPSDVWAMGCVFGEMILGIELFSRSMRGSEDGHVQHNFYTFGYPTKEEWPAYFKMLENRTESRFKVTYNPDNFDSNVATTSPQDKDLLKSMLTCAPARRITAKKALMHDYFKDEEKEKEKEVEVE